VNAALYRRIAAGLALTIALLGFALLIRTAWRGGGVLGFVLGALFVALGSGRLYLLLRRR
jgi:hypothetical protein